MTATFETKAKCLLCDAEFAKAGMSRHLKSCLGKQTETREKPGIKPSAKPFFHIVVDGIERPQYWLHLKVAADAQLADLDKFLRNIWLECCGHLSAFFIGREDELKMSLKLKAVFEPGMELRHEYDFGTTTELRIKVMGLYSGTIPKNKIEILARNKPPEIPCDECGKASAAKVCSDCIWNGEGWLCEKCAKKHDCGEDMLLPVVNSPRTGMCGYTG